MTKEATASQLVPRTEHIPFADLGWQWQQIKAKALPELEKLFNQSAFCLGPWVENFEKEVAAYLGVRHAVAVNSGTSALHLACICADIGPGDKVLVPAHTFVATLWGIVYQGATPVLCDIDLTTGTLAPDELERRMQDGVKAIIPVHLFGQPAAMNSIIDFANRHKLTVIEDAAQAIGATVDGRHVGTRGNMGCFSFYPGKNLGAAGEAGLLTTNDDAIATQARSLRVHGQIERYSHQSIGYNYRMEGIQGLILSQKLSHLESWTEQRRAQAGRYAAELQDLPLALPVAVNGSHVWHLYVVRTPLRDKLRDYLAQHGIETGLHYPIPMHRQPCFASYEFDKSSYPRADQWASQGLSLPLFAGMTAEQQDRVVDAVKEFFCLM